MPHMGNIRRNDSLNPATTCRGLTSNGRPCRRALGPSERTGYCWQHKEQVPSTTNGNAAHPAMPYTTQPDGRASIETLMQRLDINDSQAPPPSPPPKRSKKKRLLCCCFNLLTGEEPSPPPKPVQPSYHRPSTAKPPTGLSTGASVIPSTLSAETTAKLRAELDKPISDADEDGYIYMFWVTPIDSSRSAPPPVDIGSALLPSAHIPEIRSIGGAIRAAQEYGALASNPTDHSSGSVRLKIGRTNNVHRRINEWTKQCSHDLTLLRYYPYSSTATSASPRNPGITVPYVHRVERLIHLELGDIRIRDMGPCADCGKEHKEWFEVPAEREALQWVDGSIRRWCDWAKDHKRKHRR